MNFSQFYTNLGIRDVIDISLVAYLIYNVIKLLRNSRAIPVLLGLILVFFLSIIAKLLQLRSLDSILSIFISTYLAFTIIIILQPELRRIFYILGQTGWTRSFYASDQLPVEEVFQACLALSEEKTGALIVMVRNVGMNQIVEGGIELNAVTSKELLQTIFYLGNPLHDGAVIIERGQIISAATYLPLSSSSKLKRTHGARHRAGLGISEQADCLSIVISEEKKGKISVCFHGDLKENIETSQLKSILMSLSKSRLDDEWSLLFRSRRPSKS